MHNINIIFSVTRNFEKYQNLSISLKIIIHSKAWLKIILWNDVTIISSIQAMHTPQ